MKYTKEACNKMAEMRSKGSSYKEIIAFMSKQYPDYTWYPADISEGLNKAKASKPAATAAPSSSAAGKKVDLSLLREVTQSRMKTETKLRLLQTLLG